MNSCKIAVTLNIASVVKKATGIGMLSIGLVIVFMGCGKDKGELVVAQVADETITVSELQEFGGELPEHLQSKKEGIEKVKEHLQTMIDMKLMIIEVGKKGIDKSLGSLSKMHQTKKKRLVGTFQKSEIKIDIKEEEVQEFFENSHFSRAIRFSDITVDSEDKARAALEELKRGKSFEEVVRKWSINEVTAGRSGDIGRYIISEMMIPLLRNKLFFLEVGEVSEPIKVAGRYTIFKVTADSTVQLNPVIATEIADQLYRQRFSLQRAALVEKLKNKYRLELDQEGLNAFVEKLRTGASFATEDERNIVVYRYDKGKITSGDFMYVIIAIAKEALPNLTDSEVVVSFTERAIIPDIMIMEAAISAGIDKEEDTVKWLEKKRRKFLMSELRKKALEGKINITDDEIRHEYDSNPDKYLLPEQIDIQEILVETEEEALRLMEQIQKGISLGELASSHSIRSVEQRDEEGRFHFHPYERPLYGGIVEVAEEAQIGELKGPVSVKDGYSIFKVLSRRRPREPFSDAKRRVRVKIKNERESEIFEQFLEELREKYESQVSVREDNLKIALGTK